MTLNLDSAIIYVRFHPRWRELICDEKLIHYTEVLFEI